MYVIIIYYQYYQYEEWLILNAVLHHIHALHDSMRYSVTPQFIWRPFWYSTATHGIRTGDVHSHAAVSNGECPYLKLSIVKGHHNPCDIKAKAKHHEYNRQQEQQTHGDYWVPKKHLCVSQKRQCYQRKNNNWLMTNKDQNTNGSQKDSQQITSISKMSDIGIPHEGQRIQDIRDYAGQYRATEK